MRLLTYRTPMDPASPTRAGRLDGDQIVPLDATDVGALLADPDWRQRAEGAQGKGQALADADLAPLVPRPAKVLCVGHNYRAHIAEMHAEVPEYPTLFAKFARALVGANDDIVLPSVSDTVDWEVELTVVVGRPLRQATTRQAEEAIAGFTVGNDVSVRDWQRRTPQWLQGKTFESTTPIGPTLVTPDEVDFARDLRVRTEVDGEQMQESSTADMLFKPGEILAYASQVLTLDPGDLILTGTPSGVGSGRDPQVFLRDGQVLRTAIEGLGACINRCVKQRSHP